MLSSSSAPGSYLLEVEQPGYAVARAFPIEVWPGAESALRRPVTLRKPLSLELAVSPPVDWLGKPWRAQIYRLSDFSAGVEGSAVFDGRIGEEGRVTIAGQAPGRVTLALLDSLGNRLVRQDHEVRGPGEGPWDVQVDVITVRGRLTLGKKPLAGTIWFGGRHGSPGVKMEADADGAFHGILPRQGTWPIEVAAEAPPIESRSVVRVAADRAGRASVEIALPDTRLFGRVVDADGRPVAGADVDLNTATTDVSVRSAEDGSFEARSLETGFVQAVARRAASSGDAQSEMATVFLPEEGDVGPVELRLRRMKPVAGKVLSPLGPVVGASVEVVSRRRDVDEEPPAFAGDAGLAVRLGRVVTAVAAPRRGEEQR